MTFAKHVEPGTTEWFTMEPPTHTPYPADDRGVILLERRGEDYMAFLNYDRAIWACGKTQQEAVGELWRVHSGALVDKIVGVIDMQYSHLKAENERLKNQINEVTPEQAEAETLKTWAAAEPRVPVGTDKTKPGAAAYPKNTKQWEPGDLVIHRFDDKKAYMLMRVMGYHHASGECVTVYANEQAAKAMPKKWQNPIADLLDPVDFGIDIEPYKKRTV